MCYYPTTDKKLNMFSTIPCFCMDPHQFQVSFCTCFLPLFFFYSCVFTYVFSLYVSLFLFYILKRIDFNS